MKSRSRLEVRPRSSVALTMNAHAPSCSGVPSARRAFHWNGYVPGASLRLRVHAERAVRAAKLDVTVEGRTTLYVNVSVSATPSPFGDTAGADGGEA